MLAVIDGIEQISSSLMRPSFKSRKYPMSIKNRTTDSPKRPQSETPTIRKSQSQRERFIETAKKLEADESGEAFEKAFSKVIQPSKYVSIVPSAPSSPTQRQKK